LQRGHENNAAGSIGCPTALPASTIIHVAVTPIRLTQWGARTPNKTKQSGRTPNTTKRCPNTEHEQDPNKKPNTFRNRTPNKTPNTNKRFPNTEQCSGAALVLSFLGAFCEFF